MNVLIVGATGTTGRLLTEQLLERGHFVKVIVRTPEKLPEAVRNHDNLTIIRAAVLDLSDAEMAQHVHGCDAVPSCLGHNVTFKGMYGHPRKLVTDATRRLCQAIRANNPNKSTKFVLMNTDGNSNRDIFLVPAGGGEPRDPPRRTEVGQNDRLIEWTAVRPDTLLDEATVTDYQLVPSPIESALFGSRETSRINVAHFMADLMTDEACWAQWKGQMPVIYNQAEAAAPSQTNASERPLLS